MGEVRCDSRSVGKRFTSYCTICICKTNFNPSSKTNTKFHQHTVFCQLGDSEHCHTETFKIQSILLQHGRDGSLLV